MLAKPSESVQICFIALVPAEAERREWCQTLHCLRPFQEEFASFAGSSLALTACRPGLAGRKPASGESGTAAGIVGQACRLVVGLGRKVGVGTDSWVGVAFDS